MKVLLLWGWLCSLITFLLTIILANTIGIVELNPIMNIMLKNTYLAIIGYGIVWACIFAAYQYYRRWNMPLYTDYLCALVGFTFTFNLLHDLISLYGGI